MTYEYKFMFEERCILVLAYNLETVLAEKMEAIISRGTLNTRMRDYYENLAKALEATSTKRESYGLLSAPKHILEQIKSDTGLMKQWGIYQRKYDYAADYDWEDIAKNIEHLFEKLM